MDMKRCESCGETKSLDEFPRHWNMPDGHLNTCRACRKGSGTAFYAWYKQQKALEQEEAEARRRAEVRVLEQMVEERAAWEVHVSKCRRIEDVRGIPTRDRAAAPEPAIFIYSLTDPRSRAICYVGITQRPAHRYRDHLGLDPKNPAKQEWVRELAAAGQLPEMHLLEVISTGEYDAQWQEQRWISTFEHVGMQLLNQDHGDGPYISKSLPTE